MLEKKRLLSATAQGRLQKTLLRAQEAMKTRPSPVKDEKSLGGVQLKAEKT
jgi:hypothetical protein